MKKIVSKFGGTSMGDVSAMEKSAAIVCQRKSLLVVVSATSGTTNDLIALAEASEKSAWDKAEALLFKIRERHNAMAKELNLNETGGRQLEEMLSELESMARGIYLLKDCSLKAMDSILAYGELFSSILFTCALEKIGKNKFHKSSPWRVEWLDARKVLITTQDFGKARPLDQDIREKCQYVINNNDSFENVVYVTQGFIGATREGLTTTLGRGGSDYSAAILAEAISADILEIWTDVPGIATTDPRLCPKAKIIPEISFKEASELATFGAKILHPATLAPAMRAHIPVFVGSTFAPDAGGTWVKKEVQTAPLVRALALRKNQVLLTLQSPDMLNAHGFLYQIFKIFNDHKVSVDAITTSEISVALTLDPNALKNPGLILELEKLTTVTVEENLTLVSLIGNHINHTPGLGEKIFSAIAGINVRMICLGASIHNFCFIVEGKEGDKALQKLHQTFIEEKSL